MGFYEIELSPKTSLELDKAYEWYEERLAGLGSRLLKEINKYLTTISKNPKLFQVRFQCCHSPSKQTLACICLYVA